MGKPINVEQHINDRYKEVLGGMSVNFQIPDFWYTLATQVLFIKSPMSMGLSAKEYRNMAYTVEKKEIVDCYTFAGLNNEIEAAEPRIFAQDLDDYSEMMQECESLAAKWREQCGDIKEKIVDQVLKEFAQVKPKNNKELN